MKPSIFISLDIEADGPNIHKNSCIQVGLVACYKDVDDIFNFEWIIDKLVVSINQLPRHIEDPKTMEDFWSKNQDVYQDIKGNSIPPRNAIEMISSWLLQLSKKYTIREFIARPASYDWLWFCQIYQRFPHKYKLPFSVTCVSTMKNVLQMIGGRYDDVVPKKHLPPHTHNAGDDAISQAYIYLCLVHYFSNLRV